jgi:hypothetical protein
VCNHYNICNILIYFYNIHLKQLQHTSETSETLETCNMRFQHIATSPCYLRNGGSSARGVHRRQPRRRHRRPDWTPHYYEAAGTPSCSLISWARHAARPCNRRHSPHHHLSRAQWIWWKEQRGKVGRRRAARDAGKRPPRPGDYAARLGHCGAGPAQRVEVFVLWATLGKRGSGEGEARAEMQTV